MKRKVKNIILILFRIVAVLTVMLANLWIYSYANQLRNYLLERGIELIGMKKVEILATISIIGIIVYVILSKVRIQKD